MPTLFSEVELYLLEVTPLPPDCCPDPVSLTHILPPAWKFENSRSAACFKITSMPVTAYGYTIHNVLTSEDETLISKTPKASSNDSMFLMSSVSPNKMDIAILRASIFIVGARSRLFSDPWICPWSSRSRVLRWRARVYSRVVVTAVSSFHISSNFPHRNFFISKKIFLVFLGFISQR